MEACRLLSEMLRAHSWPGTQVSRLVVEASSPYCSAGSPTWKAKRVQSSLWAQGCMGCGEVAPGESLFGSLWGRGKATSMRWHFLPKVLLGVTFLGWTGLVPATAAPHFHHLR